MGIRMVFYFILQLLCLIRPASPFEAGETGCEETCGAVAIPHPFGIKTGCYYNSWFRVTCNKTVNGTKPFITRINMELLHSPLSFIDNVVTVNNPVTYLNCDDKGNNGTTSPSSVNLQDSPFFFSSEHNSFGSVGCGYLAMIFRNNQTDPIALCLQRGCEEPISSELAVCLSKVPENLASYTTALRSMTEIISPGEKEFSKRCTSAFMFGYSTQLSEISIDMTHVPATLEWINPVNCDLEASLCSRVGVHHVFPYKTSCNERCGNVDIPFPFGIKAGCYNSKWFRVTCNKTADGEKPFISSINMQLLNVSFYEGIVLVNNSVIYSNCPGKDREKNEDSINLTGTPFFFSHIFDRFMSIGCGNLATFPHSPTNDHRISGCKLPPCENNMTSIVRCAVNIPSGLSSFVANITQIYPNNGSKRSCTSAFIVDKSFLDFPEANSDHNDTITNRSWTHVPTTLQWGKTKRGLCELGEKPGTLCSPDGRYCWTSLSQMHLCVCTSDDVYDGYDVYLSTDVCQEKGECVDTKYKNYFMLCLNAGGNNCSSCPDGYRYSRLEQMCRPVLDSSEFPTKKSKRSQNLPVIIGCSASIGTIVVLIGTWHMHKLIERRNNIKLKQKYFKRNGGLLLQQQLSNNKGNVEKIKLFASKELEKATDYYNENRILGRGGQGTVFKGMLTDGSIVAIKKSKMTEDKKLDENEVKQFINEVMILSQINHRNVVKLLGCCLETKVPLLVYEFVLNGTLSQLLHVPNEEFPLTWEMRLRIAIEIANALSYLHSAASVPIYHRDIKSSNILLDDKYRAKVSDFGTSRSVALEQTHVTTRVQEKSDVYSFGVVLVELISGQKPISSCQSEEVVRSLANFFLHSMKENSLLNIVDPLVMNDNAVEEIVAVAKLAKRCLNLNGKRRPTMKQVALELERIRSSEEANFIQQIADEDSDMVEMIEASGVASFSTSGSFLEDSATLSIDA
ncbi:wall-associated receptor kinase-like 1 [Gossypium australe]|uniref:Wall-associated receptor kinase-like 1 n=1 Tax=Gossypium australe TaxID=47621 RepID=A0A5B6WVU1_9ROSI|nr:wall-associated receptor kinase-like 1 [Gossypium australe]